jgi:hypothetical protein
MPERTKPVTAEYTTKISAARPKDKRQIAVDKTRTSISIAINEPQTSKGLYKR